MSAAARISSPLDGLLPHPRLDRGLTQSLGQLAERGLQLLLAGRRAELPGGRPGLAGLEELAFPVADLLRGLMSTGSYRALVIERGWSLDRCRSWVRTTLRLQIGAC